ncbi:MAG TPA: hypothetical protein VGO07_01140 [Candidatus Saccharimonadales bacterium]|jgi:hypothetical protein|nr:hypothetical protein [Candidatus Saccharimonadales bacterium]
MEKEVSGEEFRRMSAEAGMQPANFVAAHRTALISVAVLAVVAGISFTGGIQYQKGKGPATPAAIANQSANGPTGFRSFGGPQGQRPTAGTVKAVSSTSITVTSDRTGTDSTLAITNTTVVTNADATAAVSDIQVGNTVFVQAASNDPNTATRIMLNPTMMRGPGGGAAGGTTNTDTQSL